jgi:hypothetical protein
MMILVRGLLLLLQAALVVLLEVAQGHSAVRAAALLLSVGQQLEPAAAPQQNVLTADLRVRWC